MVTKLKNNKKILYVTIAVFILVVSILIPLGFSVGTDSATTFFDSTKSSAGGQYLKDAIDDINYYCSKNCPRGKICKSNTYKCIRATTLHTEICTINGRTWPYGYCQASGYSNGTTITYGNTVTHEGILTTGDAFDCDVNGDGTYDASTERFYYVSDYYDTGTKNFNDKVAVLIYYSNVKAGVASTATTAYDCTGKNYNGPVTARAELPTTTQWNNITLYQDTRQIMTNAVNASTNGDSLPITFSYAGYSARLLTFMEAFRGCNSFDKIPSSTGGLDAKCQFLMEGTHFSDKNTYFYDSWLETPVTSDTVSARCIDSNNRYLNSMGEGNTNGNYTSNTKGVKPVIEVLKSEISY